MKPREPVDDGAEDLFRHHLLNIINPRHELVRLGQAIDWKRFDEAFGANYGEKGRPTRLNEFAKRIFRTRPQWTLTDFVAFAAEGDERMIVIASADPKVIDLQSGEL